MERIESWIWLNIRRIDSFPGSSVSKEFVCNTAYPCLIPGLGRSSGEENGNSLQYSCLENPMNRGAWRATVHGVSKNQTWLSNWHTQENQIIWMHVYSQTWKLELENSENKISDWRVYMSFSMWLGLQHSGLSMGQISCMVSMAPSMIVQQAMQDTAWSFLTKFLEATQHHFHSFILIISVTSPHKFKRSIQKPHLLMETVSCGIEVNVVDTVEKYSLTQKVLFWPNELWNKTTDLEYC